MKSTLIFLFLINSTLALGKINIISYNMGQLQRNGFDFVPCVNTRLPAQIQAIFGDNESPIFAQKHFIMGLQEVWTKRAFTRLKFESNARNFTIVPRDFSDVMRTGLITISNLKPKNFKIHNFKDSDYSYKSFILSQHVLGDGTVIDFYNVHTDFSSWGIINKAHLSQVTELSQFVKKQSKDLRKNIILVGDFNSGPYTFSPRSREVEKNKIWHEKLYPQLKKMNLNHLNIPGYSWDMKKNQLAIKPTFILNIYNLLMHATINWEEKSEKIDHIFVSKNIQASNERLIFDEHKKFKCFGRTDRFGKAALSDHYGIQATIDLPKN